MRISMWQLLNDSYKLHLLYLPIITGKQYLYTVHVSLFDLLFRQCGKMPNLQCNILTVAQDC